MSEIRQALWAHGFGSSPDIDPPSKVARRVARSPSINVGLKVPGLSQRDSHVLTVLPLAEQAQRLRAALAEEPTPDLVIAHSQGAWALAEALMAEPARRLAHLVLLAPPLAGPAERLRKSGLRDPSAEEQKLACEYGGVRGVIDWELLGEPQVTVVPEGYWDDITNPDFDPLALVRLALSRSDTSRIIAAGNDEKLGDQADEFHTLAQAMPGVRVETMAGADHAFRGRDCAAVAARAAFSGVGISEAAVPFAPVS